MFYKLNVIRRETVKTIIINFFEMYPVTLCMWGQIGANDCNEVTSSTSLLQQSNQNN